MGFSKPPDGILRGSVEIRDSESFSGAADAHREDGTWFPFLPLRL